MIIQFFHFCFRLTFRTNVFIISFSLTISLFFFSLFFLHPIVKVNNELRVIRGCGYLNDTFTSDEESNVKVNQQCIRSGTISVMVEYCSCSSGEGCNSAQTLNVITPIMAVLLTLFSAFHFLLWIFSFSHFIFFLVTSNFLSFLFLYSVMFLWHEWLCFSLFHTSLPLSFF